MHRKAASRSIVWKTIQRVCLASSLQLSTDTDSCAADYPRTLREWDRRLKANLTQDMLASDMPELQADESAFQAFKRKWHYLFAYAGAGFAKGYITCHMMTFIREVSSACGTFTQCLTSSVAPVMKDDTPAPCD